MFRISSVLTFAVAVALAQSGKVSGFEVASMKASPPADRPIASMRGGPGTNSPGQFTCANQTLRTLVSTAWDLKGYQLSGPPSMDTTRYDVTAKVPAETTRKDFLLMLQRLLAERVGLTVHHESREMAVYEMVVAKGGVKMKDAAPAPDIPVAQTPGRFTMDGSGFAQVPPGRTSAVVSGLGGVFRISARMQGLQELLHLMETHSGRPVIDKTELTAWYDFTLAFARDSSATVTAAAGTPARVAAGLAPLPSSEPSAPTNEAREPAPGFLDAIVRQLGLKLEAARAAIDVVCVDRFDRVPTEN